MKIENERRNVVITTLLDIKEIRGSNLVWMMINLTDVCLRRPPSSRVNDITVV
jgi:hypothetical protein